MPTLLATAVAPMLGVRWLEAFGPEGMLIALAIVGVVNLALVAPRVLLARTARDRVAAG